MVAGNITVVDSSSTSASGQSGQSLIVGTPTANSTVSFAVTSQYIAPAAATTGTFQISGTWTGTLAFEGSFDNGSTWVAIDAITVGVNTILSSITSNGLFKANISGLTNFRVRATATVTGTASVNLSAFNANDLNHIDVSVNVSENLTVSVQNGANGTWQVGQGKVASTGTAVQLSSTSYVLQNGLIIAAYNSNASAGVTIGTSSVTNTVSGSGNGLILLAGNQVGIPAGVNLNTIYIDGTSGDIVSYSGN